MARVTLSKAAQRDLVSMLKELFLCHMSSNEKALTDVFRENCQYWNFSDAD